MRNSSTGTDLSSLRQSLKKDRGFSKRSSARDPSSSDTDTDTPKANLKCLPRQTRFALRENASSYDNGSRLGKLSLGLFVDETWRLVRLYANLYTALLGRRSFAQTTSFIQALRCDYVGRVRGNGLRPPGPV